MKKFKIITMTAFILTTLTLIPATAMALEVGDKAPSFSAKSTQGIVNLTDYIGKKNVILALYFAVFTPV